MTDDEMMKDGTLISFIDDIELARFYAEKAGFEDKLNDGLVKLYEGLVALDPLLRSIEDIGTLSSKIGTVFEDLKNCCSRNELQTALDTMTKAEQQIGETRTALSN